jgi:hypothetical protein
MIHAYEGIYKQDEWFPVRQSLRDMLTFRLYNHLKPKIENLDERILNHAHSLRQEDILIRGGSHGILFFLKSLDLDLRLGLKLGTVCGYGREEF